jgi:hypothetical protein
MEKMNEFLKYLKTPKHYFYFDAGKILQQQDLKSFDLGQEVREK